MAADFLSQFVEAVRFLRGRISQMNFLLPRIASKSGSVISCMKPFRCNREKVLPHPRCESRSFLAIAVIPHGSHWRSSDTSIV